jgi:IclR family acetate operon transcriptional repressor
MTANDLDPKAESEFSLTVARALQILLSFGDGRSELGISELGRELSQHKVSVQRNMRALEKYGFVEQNPVTRKYRIGVQVHRLGRLFAYSRLVETHAEPLMQDLVTDTGYTSYLATLRKGKMLIIASYEGNGPIRFSIPVGTVLPIPGTAVGKAALSVLDDEEQQAVLRTTDLAGAELKRFLRELAEVRKAGFATVDSKHFPGVGAVAAPILGSQGQLVAVVSIGFAVGQATRAKVLELGRQIQTTAGEIARRLALDEKRSSSAEPRRPVAARRA